MRKKRTTVVGILIVLCAVALAQAGVGESAVITLVFPHGARFCTMGEAGVALADDEHAMFSNPAGLGIQQDRWKYGAATWFYEPLLPAFGIRDLWHTAVAGVYQPPWPGTNWGTFGIDLNYINMGVNQWYDELGRETGSARSREWILSISRGAPILNLENHFWGVSAKVGRSMLAPGLGTGGEGTATVLAADLGYLWRFGPGFSFGTTATNMGPSVFYISEEDSDPIPFNIRLGAAYVDTIRVGDWPVLSLAVVVDTYREFVKTYPDREPDPFYKALFTSLDESFKEEFSEVQWGWGMEVEAFETVALRTGFLYDWVGERYELEFGFGIKAFNHIQFDWGYIHSPEGMLKTVLKVFDPDKTGATGARHGQWRVSLSVIKAFKWTREDLIPLNFDKAPFAPPSQPQPHLRIVPHTAP